MNRRELLKFGLAGAVAAAGGTGFFKIYKRTTGVRKIFEYPDPILRRVKRPAFIKVKYSGLDNSQYELTAAKGNAALLAHEIDHLDGILYIDYA